MNLSKREKHTFLFLLSASVFNGISFGVLILQEFILRKTLSGTPLEVTLLVMMQPVSNLFSIFAYDISKRFKSKQEPFLFIGVFGKLILIMMLFVNRSFPFLLVLGVFYIFHSIMNPLYSNLMQLNFSKENRGFLYGISTSVSVGLTLIVSLLAGRLMDIDQNYFKILFLFSGITGFLCCYMYFKVKIKKVVQESHERKKRGFAEPIFTMIEILMSNREFRRYEGYFFLYGIGYLVILPALPIYFVDYLKLDYSQISFIKGFIGQSGYVLFLPLMGIFMDRLNIFVYSSATFFLLSFYPLLLLFSGWTSNPLILVYAAFFVYSISMSAVAVIWDLASITFAGEKNSRDYQSTHVVLTGIRGIIAPMAGLIIMQVFSIQAVFAVSFAFFLLSSIMMVSSYFEKRRAEALQLRKE